MNSTQWINTLYPLSSPYDIGVVGAPDVQQISRDTQAPDLGFMRGSNPRILCPQHPSSKLCSQVRVHYT